MYGLVITADGVAEALAPMLAASLRDQRGSYADGFAALIILAVVGTIAISLLPKHGDVFGGKIPNDTRNGQ